MPLAILAPSGCASLLGATDVPDPVDVADGAELPQADAAGESPGTPMPDANPGSDSGPDTSPAVTDATADTVGAPPPDAAPDSPPPPVCTPGALQCAGPQPQVCNAGGQWQDVPCSPPPPSTAQCIGGRCITTLASNQRYPVALAVDTTNAYWASTGQDINVTTGTMMSGSIDKVPLGGGASTTLAGALQSPLTVAADSAFVYWADYYAGLVLRVPIAGGASTTLASGGSPEAVAVNATSVFWVDRSTVQRMLVNGSGQRTIALGQSNAWAVAIDATSVYWANGDSGSMGRNGSIVSAPLGGGNSTTLASGQDNPYAVAVDATTVYWVNTGSTNGGGAVMAVPLAGGTATTLASAQDYPYAVAVDATNVYWCNGGGGMMTNDGTIRKVPLAGGAPTTIASGLSNPVSVAVDATSVYWTEYVSAGAVKRATPK
jgi:hypothetical protein